jgi:hypothetical protein
LSSQFIGGADDCGFCDALVQEEGCFDFGRTQTMTRDVDDIIDTATNPVESLVISTSAITSELGIRMARKTGKLRSIQDRVSDRRP